jgi:ubiquinone/menaquinone biosynthesis C-methylase UbiE
MSAGLSLENDGRGSARGHNLVCPWWLGYALVSPLRRLLENPEKILGPYVRPGARVLEVGTGMGYFTLPLARLLGETGRIVCLDVQPRMLAALERRARRAGVAQRVETRLCAADTLGLSEERGFDLALLLHVLHEMPDAGRALREIREALSPDGRLLLVEPPGHVTAAAFALELEAARTAGLVVVQRLPGRSRGALLSRAA